MLMDLISKYNGNELCDPCKDEVGMERFFVLCLTACQTETVLEMVDGTFYGSPDFIGRIPFFRAADRSRISPKILFRIDIYHPAGLGIRAWIFTVADTVIFPVLPFIPSHFGADKFQAGDSGTEMGSVPFLSHWQGWIIWTAWDAVFVYRVILILKTGTGIQGDICFIKVPATAKGIARQKALINFHGIKSGIAQKCFWFQERMGLEQINQGRDQEPCIMNGFVLIRGIRFLFNFDFGMLLEVVLVIEGNVPDDTESVCNESDTKRRDWFPVACLLFIIKLFSVIARGDSFLFMKYTTEVQRVIISNNSSNFSYRISGCF